MNRFNFILDINIREKLYLISKQLIRTVTHPFSYISSNDAEAKEGIKLSIFSILMLTVCTYIPSVFHLGINQTHISYVYLSLVVLYVILFAATAVLGVVFSIAIPSKRPGGKYFTFSLKDKIREGRRFLVLTTYQTARNLVLLFSSFFFISEENIMLILIIDFIIILSSILSTTLIIKNIRKTREVLEINLTLFIFIIILYFASSKILM